MIRAAVDDTQGMTRGGKVKVDPLHHRAVRVLEVNEYHSANAGSGLIHQAAGLSKVDILRILTHLGDFYSRELLIEE